MRKILTSVVLALFLAIAGCGEEAKPRKATEIEYKKPVAVKFSDLEKPVGDKFEQEKIRADMIADLMGNRNNRLDPEEERAMRDEMLRFRGVNGQEVVAKSYKFEIDCPHCGKQIRFTCDGLTKKYVEFKPSKEDYAGFVDRHWGEYSGAVKKRVEQIELER